MAKTYSLILAWLWIQREKYPCFYYEKDFQEYPHTSFETCSTTDQILFILGIWSVDKHLQSKK